ncbi:MAG TPA: RsmD family RNA methyltransferase [Candidatus Sulfotelmatobacter sp.]|nr:RsmD family RNA methyltransferase [Candidatus Sulfotelmatobacter sp.]
MRVISGTLGGREISSPKKSKIHPMSDKMRGALFTSLGDINELDILDAYSGSGAIAIEAISRGANQAIALDNDQTAIDTIKQNIKVLGISDRVKAIRASIAGYLDNNPDQTFDIIFADPPYSAVNELHLNKLATHLKPNCIFVLSCPGKSNPLLIEGLKELKNNVYGDAQLVFYRKIS